MCRVEQETRLATIAANRATTSERLVNGNLKAQLVKAAHQAHEAIVDRTITTPQTTAVELTQIECMNERRGGHGAVVHRRAALGRFQTETEDHAPRNEACAVQVAEAHWTVRSQTVRTSAAGLHWRGRASDVTPPNGAMGGAEAHPNSCHEAERTT